MLFNKLKKILFVILFISIFSIGQVYSMGNMGGNNGNNGNNNGNNGGNKGKSNENKGKGKLKKQKNTSIIKPSPLDKARKQREINEKREQRVREMCNNNDVCIKNTEQKINTDEEKIRIGKELIDTINKYRNNKPKGE